MSFKNKVVIVTGASSGIGAAIAIGFAKEGAEVAMIGRNETKLAAVAQMCMSNGKPPLIIIADVSKDDDAKIIVERTVNEFGKLDILINNAAISSQDITNDTLLQAYDEMFATNLRAPMQLTSIASQHLIKTKGNIVNISAVAGQRVLNIPQLLPYGVSKAALNHFTLGAALELSVNGVRVNAVSPGPVYSDFIENSKLPVTWDRLKKMTRLNRISEPEEIADLVLFLASEKAKGITGSNYISDNGLMLNF